MSSSIHIVEPRPKTNTTHIHISRGGAGNIAPTSTTTAFTPFTAAAASRPPLRDRKPKVFLSGRGGAGNVHHSSERAIFSFDEELEQQMRQLQDLAPICHVGRGGAGNTAYLGPAYRRNINTDADSTISGSTTASHDQGFGDRVKRGWAKMTEHF